MNVASSIELKMKLCQRRLKGIFGAALLLAVALLAPKPWARAASVALRGPMLQNVTTDAATIVVETPTPQPLLVYYRVSDAPITRKIERAAATRHEIRVIGLSADVRVIYTVVSGSGSVAQRRRGEFSTAPNSFAKPFKFAAWGDSGAATGGQKALAAQIEAFAPDFMVHTGDLIYPRGAAHDYPAKFWMPYAQILSNAPFYPSLGNHDIMTRGGAPFLNTFSLPRNGPKLLEAERNYSFRWGGAQVWVLDTNVSLSQMRGVLAPWLANGLKSSRATWKIVVFHQPPYSSGLHGGWDRTRNVLAPVLVSYGADLVLNGHDHSYERFAPRGTTTFIVTGAGGAVRYPKRRNERGSVRFHNAKHSFSAFEVSGKTLRARQIAADGEVIDSWTLKK